MKQNFIEYIHSHIRTNELISELTRNDSVEINLPIGASPFILSELNGSDSSNKNVSNSGFVDQNVYAKGKNTCYYITRDDIEAEEVFESLLSIGAHALFFPDIDVIPFSNVFPSADKLSDRINTLYTLSKDENPIVVLTLESLMRKLPPESFFCQSIYEFKTGGLIERNILSKMLVQFSYIRDFKVTQQGSFSVRGDIVDIFPPNYREAIRINLFGDEIESIKLFNPMTQLSTQNIDSFKLIPASEFAIIKDIIKEEFIDLLEESHIHSHFLKFYNSFSTILEYSPGPGIVIYHESLKAESANLIERFKKYTPEKEGMLLLPLEEVFSRNKGLKKIIIKNMIGDSKFPVNIQNPPEFGEGFSRFVTDIENVYLAQGYRIFILVEYKDLAEKLMNILKKFSPSILENDKNIGDGNLFILILNFEHGFELRNDNTKILVLTESDISGKKRLFRKRIRQIDTIFEDIESIKEGESVVHLNYGIGIFKGIERISVLGKEKDYILLEYAENEKLFVPLEQSNLIGKYIGGSAKKPPLDSLGGKSWAKKRDRVKKSIEDFAEKLVAIYAKRLSLSGHTFGKDTLWQKDFEDKFEYIETPDQVKVIEEIKKDMESAKPMDRLLCGDVGFGKTEVAMRSAFKAVMDGKQVALIAPTTVLVEQHYYTFIERFKNFPVRVEYISRFTESQKLKETIKAVEHHRIDILIGTHLLFSDKIRFHALGLVIIDEEHKFGVIHKEILKSRYPLVDFLSLSATPIPRTLNMAMANIRDISLLQTPPDMRIPVETYVSDFSMDLVKYAIEKEINRNGQVFFVHNTIKRLPEYAFLIERMLPQAKVTIGHGQMEEEELDKAFMGFVRGEYNVFVCTTIIDSGLDIPNANTIIVSDAHRFGLSQLYQLKGRVGRAKKQGYAYFLYPQNRALTETAQKRLFVINEYTDLGAGFNIALQDLEIRGAGNILGREQHGNMIAVGYDVYMRLLREEVEKLKGDFHEKVETLIDLNYDAYIPDELIPDNGTKMEVYKKILSVRNEEEIRMLSEELVDRFGKVPAEVGTLFEISRLKIKAENLGIESIIEKGEYIEINFSKFSKVDAVKVMRIKAENKHEIVVKPHEKHKLYYKSFDSNITIKVKRLTGFMNDITE